MTFGVKADIDFNLVEEIDKSVIYFEIDDNDIGVKNL